MVEPFDEVAERAKIDSRPGFGCDADPGQVAESFAACSMRSSTSTAALLRSPLRTSSSCEPQTAAGVYSARHLQASRTTAA